MAKVVGFRIEIEGTDQQKKQLVGLQREFDKLTKERKELNAEERKGNVTAKEASRRRADLNTRLVAQRNALNDARAAILKQNDALRKNSGFVAGVRKGVTQSVAAFAALAAGIGATLAAFRNIAGIIAKFQQGQARLASVLGTTRSQIQELTEDAKRLGATTAFTAAQVGELQTEFAKLGFSQDEILNATEATLALAAATQSDLAQAATVAGATVRAFGLDARETQRVVDVMAKSFSSSALDLNKFQTAMANVAPVAAQAGATIEETTALLGVLVDRGVDASTAGTGLRNIFLELSKQGISFNEAMEQINSATDKNSVALELFGKRGATIGAILASTGDQADALTGKLNNAGGAAQRMADEQLDTLQGRVTILNSAWEGLILSIEDGEGIIGKTASTAIDLTTALLGILTVSKDLNKELTLSEEIQGKYNDLLDEEQKNLNQLFNILRDENTSRELKNVAISELNERYSDYLPNLLDENTSLGEIKIAQDALNGSLRENIGLRILQNELSELNSDFQKEEERNIAILAEALGKSQAEVVQFAEQFKATAAGAIDETTELTLATDEQVAANIALRNSFLDGLPDFIEYEGRIVNVNDALDSLLTTNTRSQIASTELKQIIEELTRANDELTGSFKDRGKQQEDARVKELKQLLAFLKAREDARKAGDDKLEAQIQGANNERLKQGDEFYEELDRKRREDVERERKAEQEKQDIRRNSLNSAIEGISVLEAFNQASLNRSTNSIQAAKNAETLANQQAIERAIAAAEGNEEEQAKIRESGAERQRDIDEKFAEQQRKAEIKAFNNQKFLASLQAIINGAVAIQKTSANLGYPAAIPFVALTAAQTAAQLAIINSQPTPQAARGMLVDGPSHEQGGVPALANGRLVEIEGGEAIINKRSTAAFKPILSAINQAGGGVKFQNGGVPVPTFSSSVIPAQTQVDVGMGQFAQTIIEGINSKQVVVSEQDITETQTNVQVNEQLGTF